MPTLARVGKRVEVRGMSVARKQLRQTRHAPKSAADVRAIHCEAVARLEQAVNDVKIVKVVLHKLRSRPRSLSKP